jgi:hypothetical protein
MFNFGTRPNVQIQNYSPLEFGHLNLSYGTTYKENTDPNINYQLNKEKRFHMYRTVSGYPIVLIHNYAAFQHLRWLSVCIAKLGIPHETVMSNTTR